MYSFVLETNYFLDAKKNSFTLAILSHMFVSRSLLIWHENYWTRRVWLKIIVWWKESIMLHCPLCQSNKSASIYDLNEVPLTISSSVFAKFIKYILFISSSFSQIIYILGFQSAKEKIKYCKTKERIQCITYGSVYTYHFPINRITASLHRSKG